jgi:membrane-bound lytic murein transglycosylase D
MGHGGLLTAIRKYNTNDFWELSQLEAGVPYETALYVPKILAIAFVARNKEVFNCGDLQLDPAEKFEVAAASAAPPAEKAKPGADSAKTAAASEPPVVLPPESLEKVTLRWGESLESVAVAAGTTESKLRAINNLKDPVPPRPGTEIKVPKSTSKKAPQDQPVVVVPARTAATPGTSRVFYEVVWGDKLDDVAAALGVKADELCQWNNLDRTANLHGKMVLQAFVPSSKSLKNVRLIDAKDATILTVGSEPFFEYFEAKNGRSRQSVVVKDGDTMGSLAKRHGVTLGMMERINKRSRDAALKPGETIVVYSKKTAPEKKAPATDLYADDQPSAPDIDTTAASTLQ